MKDGEPLTLISRGEKYLEHRGDGTVWCTWPDGRWVEVVCADDARAEAQDVRRRWIPKLDRLRSTLERISRAPLTAGEMRDLAREALKETA